MRLWALRNNPAAQVADRSFQHPHHRFASDAGESVGVRQGFDEPRHRAAGAISKGVDPRVSKPLVESLFQLLDNENPTRIEYLWQKIFRAHRNMRGGALMIHTLAAIDMALWTFAAGSGSARLCLLGGPARDASASTTPPRP